MKNRFNPLISLIILPLLLIFTVQTALAAGEEVLFKSNLGGSARQAIISGDNLYSLIGSKLYIADISDNETGPVELSSLSLPGKARRLIKNGDYLYISCSKGGLVSVSISSPASPVIVDTLTFDTETDICQTFDADIKDDYAYIADYTGFHVVDISSPDNMTLTSSYTDFDAENHHAYDVNISGTTAYVSSEMDGLYLFDITTPASVTRISRFSDPDGLGSQFYCSLTDNNTLYLACGEGLAILDITDQTEPELVSSIDNDFQGVISIVKSGSHVYLCTEFTDFYKINVDNASNPVQDDYYDLHGHHSLGISITNDRVVLANSTHGVKIFDVSGTDIVQEMEFRSAGRMMDCQGSGNYAYIAAGQNGLQVIDVSTPSSPTIVSTTALTEYANGLFVTGNTVYIAEQSTDGDTLGGYLEIYDITAPASPAFLGSLALTGIPYDVTVEGDVAYVSTQTSGVTLVDVSTKTAPVLLSVYDTAGVCYKPVLWGNYLILADGIDGFAMLDNKDSSALKFISDGLEFDPGNSEDIAIWDHYIYIPSSSTKLTAIDIALPYSPEEVSTISSMTIRHDTGQLKAVETFDSYLLAADSVGGLRLFDISDPSAPSELSNSPTIYGDPVQVTYDETTGLAYVSGQIIGLYIYEITGTPTAAVDNEGRWIGTATDGNTTIGITADLDIVRSDVTGEIMLFEPGMSTGDFTGTISSSEITGAIAFDSDDADIDLTFSSCDASGICQGLTGTAEIDETEYTVTLTYAGIREHLDILSIVDALQEAVTAAAAQSGTPFDLIMLPVIGAILENSSNAADLSGQISSLYLAKFLLPLTTSRNTVLAAEYAIYDSALWETYINQAIALSQVDNICDDYTGLMNLFADLGDNAFESAITKGEKNQFNSALSQMGFANKAYEIVSGLYTKNKPNCPVWGVAAFDGYYEGTINFLGIISGKFSACVEEDESGNILGDFYITIEASEEYMSGTVDTLTNTITSGDTGDMSVINGLFNIPFGEGEDARLIPIDIIGWQYNPSTSKWEGTVNVSAQQVTGTITLGKVSSDCPEGWNEN